MLVKHGDGKIVDVVDSEDTEEQLDKEAEESLKDVKKKILNKEGEEEEENKKES